MLFGITNKVSFAKKELMRKVISNCIKLLTPACYCCCYCVNGEPIITCAFND